MSKHREDSYTFCATLARTDETGLMPEEDLRRVVEARDFHSAMSVIQEFGYSYDRHLENPRDFVKILEEKEEDDQKFIFASLPDANELALLKITKDYHNAKVSLKAEFLGIDPNPYLVKNGNINGEDLVKLVKERNFSSLSFHMKDAINAAIELFSKSRDPQEIDIILDKASYSEMLKAAEGLENEFILGYVKLIIDIENVTTFVRLREMGKHRSFFQKVFLVDGNIQLQSFISSYEENFRQLADKFRPHGFGDIFETCANLENGVGMYSIMEKLCDNKRIEYIKDAKFLSFGIEPAFAFIVAKESEIKNLRMILTGKIAGTPEDIILERLRETYV